jgi:hypothetical protein
MKSGNCIHHLRAFRLPIGMIVLIINLEPLAIKAQDVARQHWTVERVIKALQAREQAIRSVDAQFRIVNETGPQASEYQAAKELAAKELPVALGIKVPERPQSSQPAAAPVRVTSQLHFYRDAQGRERHEILDDARRVSGDPKIVRMWDGSKQRILDSTGNRIEGPKNLDHLGQYLGLDLVWGGMIDEKSQSRSLSGIVQEMADRKRVSLVSDGTAPPHPGLVGLFFRHPTNNEAQNAAGGFMKDVLWFDPALGMAPVYYDSRFFVRLSDGTEMEELSPIRRIMQWQDYREHDSVKLPHTWRYEGVLGVMTPKPGVRLTLGPEMRHHTNDITVETFVVSVSSATLESVHVNQPISEALFTQEFPKGSVVYDSFNDTMYQVGSSAPPVPAALFNPTRPPASRIGGPSFFVAFVVANALLVLGGVAALVWRRRRQHRQ